METVSRTPVQEFDGVIQEMREPTALLVTATDHSALVRAEVAAAGYRVEDSSFDEALSHASAPGFAGMVLVEITPATLARLPELARVTSALRPWVPLLACCKDESQYAAAISAGADDFVNVSALATIRPRFSVLTRYKAQRDQLDAVLGCTFDAIVTIDPRGTILTCNRSAAQMFGHSPRELVGRNVSVLMPAREAGEHSAHMRRYERGGDPGIIGKGRRVLGQRRGGEIFPLFLQISELNRSGDRVYVGVMKDLSAEVKIEELRRETQLDPLTGIANRRYLAEALSNWVQQASQQGHHFAVVFVDLDDFKLVNDTYGHGAGDAVLRAVAARTAHCVSRADLVARYAGDEFVLLLDRVARVQDAMAIAHRVLERIGDWVDHDGIKVRVTGTAGVAIFPEAGQTPEELLAAADEAMYSAKRDGDDVQLSSRMGLI